MTEYLASDKSFTRLFSGKPRIKRASVSRKVVATENPSPKKKVVLGFK